MYYTLDNVFAFYKGFVCYMLLSDTFYLKIQKRMEQKKLPSWLSIRPSEAKLDTYDVSELISNSNVFKKIFTTFSDYEEVVNIFLEESVCLFRGRKINNSFIILTNLRVLTIDIADLLLLDLEARNSDIQILLTHNVQFSTLESLNCSGISEDYKNNKLENKTKNLYNFSPELIEKIKLIYKSMMEDKRFIIKNTVNFLVIYVKSLFKLNKGRERNQKTSIANSYRKMINFPFNKTSNILLDKNALAKAFSKYRFRVHSCSNIYFYSIVNIKSDRYTNIVNNLKYGYLKIFSKDFRFIELYLNLYNEKRRNNRTNDKGFDSFIRHVCDYNFGNILTVIFPMLDPFTLKETAAYSEILKSATIKDNVEDYTNLFKRNNVVLMEDYNRLIRIRARYSKKPDEIIANSINDHYGLCPTYPYMILLPKDLENEDIINSCSFRSSGRFPAIVWTNGKAFLCRSSQPKAGFFQSRNSGDEKIIQKIKEMSLRNDRFLIADARPRLNVTGNMLLGKGVESSENYNETEIVLLGIENIHKMREDRNKFLNLINNPYTYSYFNEFAQPGSNINIENPDIKPGRDWLKKLDSTKWLYHIKKILKGVLVVSIQLLDGVSVLVHCSDGWDRTSQICSLVQIALDPHYRTFEGFKTLIHREWLSFGHKFGTRCQGLGVQKARNKRSKTNSSNKYTEVENIKKLIVEKSDVISFKRKKDEEAPIFLQFIDCLFQIMKQNKNSFQFKSKLLIKLLDDLNNGAVCDFFYNSELERAKFNIYMNSKSFWYGDGWDNAKKNYVNKKYEHYDGVLSIQADSKFLEIWKEYYFRHL